MTIASFYIVSIAYQIKKNNTFLVLREKLFKTYLALWRVLVVKNAITKGLYNKKIT